MPKSMIFVVNSSNQP
ncbi:hypothetical protein Bhyg_17632 [Pseudolycoriella hygida]|uniref:Uncharacterized protein n=1 Tax=Pseudolycoriella hygida TaxID=35572 RepID=A0A9Q0MM99_9DIPT|nr:hypothetical protein Bhyg_17632 [Pseudolycoriella hygida]